MDTIARSTKEIVQESFRLVWARRNVDGCTMSMRRHRLRQRLLLIVLLIMSVFYVMYDFISTDHHQLSSYNTEEQQSWKSFTMEKVENLYHNTMILINQQADDCKECLQVDYPEIISPQEVCREGVKPSVLLLVLSRPSEFAARQAARSTWLGISKDNTGDVRYVFLVGRTRDAMNQALLKSENVMYMDILQHDYEDSYRNMTIKTVAGIRWAVRHCGQVQYMMKLDMDIWLNVPKWLNVMFGPLNDKLKYVVFGHCRRYPAVIRSPKNRYGVAVDAYSKSRHPSYCRGPAYGLSQAVAQAVAKLSYRQRFIPVEDAYVGHCLNTLGYKVFNPPGITIHDLTDVSYMTKRNPCILTDEFYVVHNVNPMELLELWQLASKC